MAAKVSIQDITDAGFRAEQFGTPADWGTTPGGYLARLMVRAEAWAVGRFGAGYASVTEGPVFERLRAAELCFCSAELWKRRAAFIDSNAASSLERMAYLDRREFEEQARRAQECAEANMALAIDPQAPAGTGGALAFVTTGPWLRPGEARL